MSNTPYINVHSSSIEHYTSSFSLSQGNNKIVQYNAIKQLYYNDFDVSTGTVEITGSHEHYLHSSDTFNIRHLRTTGLAISIPQNKVGTHIEPGSVRIQGIGGDYYVQNQDDYIVTDYFVDATGINYKDIANGSLLDNANGNKIGNVIYAHGLIIITDPTQAATFLSNPAQTISWKSNLPIYTYNYNIRLADYEFNYSNNPTAQSGSTSYHYSGSRFVRPSGIVANNVTGSDFQPYITAIGLYNDTNELIAVAKLAQPLPKSANTEMTIQIKLDI